MTVKKIESNIKLIGTNAGKINMLVQETAVAIIAHCMGEGAGDATRALRLVQALPKSFRRGLLIDWFARYSPIGMNVGTGKVGLHKAGSKAYRPFDLDGARANNWFEGTQADKEDLPDTTLEDVNKALFGLASRFQKRLDNGEVADTDREKVTALVSTLKDIAKAA